MKKFLLLPYALLLLSTAQAQWNFVAHTDTTIFITGEGCGFKFVNTYVNNDIFAPWEFRIYRTVDEWQSYTLLHYKNNYSSQYHGHCCPASSIWGFDPDTGVVVWYDNVSIVTGFGIHGGFGPTNFGFFQPVTMFYRRAGYGYFLAQDINYSFLFGPSQTSPNFNNYYFCKKFFFSTDSTGFLLGHRNSSNQWHCLRTDDYGASWDTTLTTNSPLRDVHFVTENEGYIVGDSGKVFNTTDGGMTWNLQTTPFSGSLRSVWFLYPGIGYAVGDNGTLLFTSDGGTNWNLQAFPSANNLLQVKFVNTNAGYILDVNGDLYKTLYTGIDENGNENSISVHPNPSEDIVYIDLAETGAVNYQAEVCDITGRLVEQFQVTSAHSRFSVDDLDAGIYFLTVLGDSKKITRKIVVR